MDNLEPTVEVDITDVDSSSVSMTVIESSSDINNKVNDNFNFKQGNDWIILATIRHNWMR